MRAIDEIWRAARRGEYYPAVWRGQLSMNEGYLVQLGMLARHTAAGERQAGWKVGLTARAVRQQLGVHEPVLGFLLVRGHLPTGLSIPHASLTDPRIENELCLTVGRTLIGPGVTTAQARAALTEVAPALELVENRGDFAADLPLAMADNAQQRAFITGPEVSLAAEQNLAEITLEVRVNGQLAESATGAEVMGDPAASVAWLANKLADFGLKLEAGMRVMSGSFTKQVLVRPGDGVEARFAPIGTVVARFS